ncbi:hypothetical protein AOLI_G00185610 [Acnodon oligacanthus]
MTAWIRFTSAWSKCQSSPACSGGRHLRQPGANQGERDQLLPVHEPQGQTRRQEGQYSKSRLRICGDGAGEQLHSINVSTVHRMVCGLHQKGAPSPWPPYAS